MKGALIIFGSVVGLLIMVLGAGMLWYLHQAHRPTNPALGEVELVIDQGSSYDRAVELMSYEGLVRDTFLFDLRARQRGKRVPLKAGLYRFRGDMSADEMMDVLAAGPHTALDRLPLKFQVIPGQNIWQVAASLQTTGAQPEGELLDIARDVGRVRGLGLPVPSKLPVGAHTLLEGYLFPDTYHLHRKKPSVARAVRLASTQFLKVFAELKNKHRKGYAALKARHGLRDHDFMILASLVEKEVAASAEAPQVAAVFYNGLQKGMKLMTDPTMVYGPETWDQKPSPTFRRDRKHPYNTYHLARLPPGPICNPGRQALAAVMAPAVTDALYFVAMRDGTGRHAFAKTYAEHKKNIERYLK